MERADTEDLQEAYPHMVDSPVQRDGLAAVVAKLLELGRSQPYDVVARGDGIGQPHDAGPEAVLPAQLVEHDELVGLQRSQEPVCCRRRKGGGARDLDQRQRWPSHRERLEDADGARHALGAAGSIIALPASYDLLRHFVEIYTTCS